jgi:PBP1b-binding outer membrane lipoprotein LpoB
MIKQAFVILLILSAVLISGCVQTDTEDQTTADAEDQAVNALEQELEQATENMTVEDVENTLLE